MNRLIALATTMLLAPIAAAETATAQDAPPAEEKDKQPAPSLTHSPGRPLEPAAYMGITSAIATPAARETAKLPRGVGVSVEFVYPDSPASAAGLQKGDILHRMDDQIVVNSQQLTVLTRLRKPGDAIRLAVVRNGQPLDLTVVLVSKDLPPVDEAIGMIVPADLMERAPLPRVGVGRIAGVMTHSDGEHTIIITSHDSRRTIQIKDADQKVIYEGPLNKPDDRDLIPEPLREKVEKMERGAERVRELRSAASAQH